MELKYINTDISNLQKYILQEYINMKVNKKYSEIDDFKRDLFTLAEQCIKDTKSKASFKGTYDTIKKRGLDNYNINDMDVTIMSALFLNKNSMFSLPFPTKDAIRQVNDDRNKGSSHASGNEENFELFEWAIISLKDLERLINSIQYDNDICKSDYTCYLTKYNKKIDDFKVKIREEYRLSYKKEEWKDFIKYIKNESESKCLDLYFDKKMEYFKQGKNEEKIDFITVCANEGIPVACEDIVEIYYEKKNLKKYAKEIEFYLELINNKPLRDETKLILANIYINGFSEEHSVEEGKNLLEDLKNRSGYEIYDFMLGEVIYYKFDRSKKIIKVKPEVKATLQKDDVKLPIRTKKQDDFFDKHPKITDTVIKIGKKLFK